MRRKYENKYFSILGDSISTLEGYNPPDCAVFYDRDMRLATDVIGVTDTWWGRVIECLGGRLLVNHSVSGSTVCKHLLYELPNYGCSEERAAALERDGIKPDVIMILMGVNDRGYGVRLTPLVEEEQDDLLVFSVAYRRMLRNLRERYPDAELWCLTLPFYACARNPQCAFSEERDGGRTERFCRVIRDCADEFGCRTVDLFASKIPCDTIDGLHPTADGMRAISNTVLQF